MSETMIWKSIESAPADGTRVLGWSEKWQQPCSMEFGGQWQNHGMVFAHQPTHWMPLPAPPRPTIVCLCGSTRFQEEFEAAQAALTDRGRIVLSVGRFGHKDGLDMDGEHKKMLDDLHKRKIDLADVVFVINPGGYIGESTKSEIEYAKLTNTPVEYME